MSTRTDGLARIAVGATFAVICCGTASLRAQEANVEGSAVETAGHGSGDRTCARRGGGRTGGAIVGAAAGGWLGDHLHRQAVARAGLQADLDEAVVQRAKLTQNVTELNGSLALSRHAERSSTSRSARLTVSSRRSISAPTMTASRNPRSSRCRS